jgi:hypothetical protein
LFCGGSNTSRTFNRIRLNRCDSHNWRIQRIEDCTGINRSLHRSTESSNNRSTPVARGANSQSTGITKKFVGGVQGHHTLILHSRSRNKDFVSRSKTVGYIDQAVDGVVLGIGKTCKSRIVKERAKGNAKLVHEETCNEEHDSCLLKNDYHACQATFRAGFHDDVTTIVAASLTSHTVIDLLGIHAKDENKKEKRESN